MTVKPEIARQKIVADIVAHLAREARDTPPPPKRRISERVALRRKAAAEREAERVLKQQIRKNERASRRRQQALEKMKVRRRAERRYRWVTSRLGTDPVEDARTLIAGRGRKPAPATDHFTFVVCHGLLAAACERMALDRDAVLQHLSFSNAHTGDPEWMVAARARQVAAHLAHSVVGIEPSKIARAFNIRRETVKNICRDIKARIAGDAALATVIAEAEATVMPKRKRART